MTNQRLFAIFYWNNFTRGNFNLPKWKQGKLPANACKFGPPFAQPKAKGWFGV
jgi:hypothetical protein